MTKSIKDFEGLIQDGPGPGAGGFKAETANGTAHWRGTGHNKDKPFEMPEVAPSAVWPEGRSNRTGE